MIPLIKLKKEVEFNSELKQVVDALKGIAMNRYLMLQKKLQLFERFPELAGELLEGISIGDIDHPYIRSNNKRVAVLMVTSDGGFVGNMNAQVIQAGLTVGGEDAVYAIVGDRGASMFADQKKQFHRFPGVDDKKRAELAAQVREKMLGFIASGECGKFVVVYPKPISMSMQKATVEAMIPCDSWLSGQVDANKKTPETIWESEPRDILSYVATFWVEHRLDEIFSVARVAELGARVMNLEGSFQEVIRQGKKIKLQYHRARHEVIDRSMREVFSSQLLFNRLAEEEARMNDGK